jgi:hypothetical protein
MKPEQFIREFGVERAKELINDHLHPKMTHVSDDGRHWVNEHNKNLGENIRKQLPTLMQLNDLKCLVESLDLINEFDDLEQAKSWIDDLDSDMPYQVKGSDKRFFKWQLIEAVRDHESIYGGGGE